VCRVNGISFIGSSVVYYALPCRPHSGSALPGGEGQIPRNAKVWRVNKKLTRSSQGRESKYGEKKTISAVCRAGEGEWRVATRAGPLVLLVDRAKPSVKRLRAR